jgi:very-short-patch-repair endonuclease
VGSGRRYMANERARQLRKSMTPQEVKLWVQLRSWRSRGFHFRRQAPRGGYILDFVCLRERLVVEVDGGQHGAGGQVTRDGVRDDYFAMRGFKVLRFWNNDIDRNLAGVLDCIDRELRNCQSPTPALRADPPPDGGGMKRQTPDALGRSKEGPHGDGCAPSPLAAGSPEGSRTRPCSRPATD